MEELIKVAINGGVGVVLALVVLRWQREDGKTRAEECKQCAIQAKAWAVQEREDKVAMRAALEGNTRAIAIFTEVIRGWKSEQERHPERQEVL
jgi:hypothetical protein